MEWKLPVRKLQNFGIPPTIVLVSLIWDVLTFVTENFVKCKPELLIEWKAHLVLIQTSVQTSLLLLCKSSCSYAN